MQESQAGWEGGGPLDIRKSLVVVGMENEIIDLYLYFIERILNIIRAKLNSEVSFILSYFRFTIYGPPTAIAESATSIPL